MKTHTPKIAPDTVYQIFNRGINGEALFKCTAHYSAFLKKINRFLSPVADLYAYCLMEDHFHLCLRTLPENDIFSNLKSDRHKNPDSTKTCSWHISNQFASLFKSHALSVNHGFQRTGGLFEEPFRRFRIVEDADFRWLISLIHANPKIHSLQEDFAAHPHSSFAQLLSTNATFLDRDFVLSQFGGKAFFESFHKLLIPRDVYSRISMD